MYTSLSSTTYTGVQCSVPVRAHLHVEQLTYMNHYYSVDVHVDAAFNSQCVDIIMTGAMVEEQVQLEMPTNVVPDTAKASVKVIGEPIISRRLDVYHRHT